MEIFIIFALAALLIGLAKGGLGGPVTGTLALPVMSLAMPVSQAAGVLLPLLILGDMFALYFYWNQWNWRYIRLLLPAAIIGIVCGTLLLTHLSNDALKHVLGVFTLIVIAYRLISRTTRFKSLVYQPRDWHGYLAGWASGFGSALANAGAPPFSVYMLLQPGMTPIDFTATAALFFATVNLLKVPAFLGSGVLDLHLFLSIAWLLPIIPLAVWIGRKSLHFFDQVLFERVVLFTLFLLSLSFIL